MYFLLFVLNVVGVPAWSGRICICVCVVYMYLRLCLYKYLYLLFVLFICICISAYVCISICICVCVVYKYLYLSLRLYMYIWEAEVLRAIAPGEWVWQIGRHIKTDPLPPFPHSSSFFLKIFFLFSFFSLNAYQHIPPTPSDKRW